MRWALVKVCLAVTVMVVVAFAVPLALVVRETARDRAFANAERQASAIAPALAITRDRRELQRAVAITQAGAEGRIAVHIPDGTDGGGGSGDGSDGRDGRDARNNGDAREGRDDRDGDKPSTADADSNGDRADRADRGDNRRARGDEPAVGHTRAPDDRLAAAQRLGRASTVPVGGGYALLRPTAVAGGKVAVVEVFVPDEEVTHGVATSWVLLAGVGVALIVGSVAVADRLGTRMVRPAERLAGAAHDLGEGELDVRVPVEGPKELRSAAVAFNSMADQVVQLLAGERELAADLSHRLRTPLTVLRLNAASLGEGDAADQTRAAVAQLEGEVDRIISAVREQRAQSPGGGNSVASDAAEVVRERMGFWSALAEDEGREARVAGVERPVRVPVARAELAAAVDALLGNVFRHTPEGTAFSVDLHSGGPGSDAVIVLVSDAGPGIADPQAALRRGHGAGGPGSTGLGLDIVRRVAESTGGDVRLGRSVLGGTEVRVWLALRSSAGRGPAGGRGRRSRRARHTSHAG
ncbi:HAMP domain-containing histidine kinase [Streptomyces oryzae]|uniref:Signal transduction histidine-protein kinase/phosphatase MprB n=1 Tax=Streptomyces oryzae TaxID=1434886 RepID=A0ABS3XMN2_9ACTN|nr:HAMP domain-containing sensor histidine kinase [Streptomyces oryzae]MBO8196553.1 HAMP domain-containing histidine kinase [Streptomyces oryzae]